MDLEEVHFLFQEMPLSPKKYEHIAYAQTFLCEMQLSWSLSLVCSSFAYVSYSLNSLKEGYIGEYIRDHYRGY